MPSPAASLRLSIDGPIATLTIDNQPRLNAFTRDMWAAVPDRIRAAEAEPAVRAIIITGAGAKAFSAGADITEFATSRTGEAARDYDAVNHAAYVAVLGCAKPVIAAVQGYCFGGACELAICCDLRVAATDAQFSIPAAKLALGYNPRWIAPMLAVISAAKAKEMLFTGRRYGADAALAMGLVNTVVPPAALAGEALRLAGEIAANAPLSIRAAKQAVDAIAPSHAAGELARLDALVDACFQSADFIEGQRAFAEKRKPKFSGC